MLKALPVSVLKLDGMFFRTAKDDEQAKIVIRNIMRMAGELKMATVAEGVETHEQVAFLETTGCDIIQGYVFARPMPAAEFTELLAGRVGTQSVDRKKAVCPENGRPLAVFVPLASWGLTPVPKWGMGHSRLAAFPHILTSVPDSLVPEASGDRAFWRPASFSS